MIMLFTIKYCDIELEHYLQILVNKRYNNNSNVYYLKHTYTYYIHNSIQQKVRSEAAWLIFPLIMYTYCLCVQVQ